MKNENNKVVSSQVNSAISVSPPKHIVLGLSKREQIATSVLQAILSNEKYLAGYDQSHLISLSLSYTDALIKALGDSNEKV